MKLDSVLNELEVLDSEEGTDTSEVPVIDTWVDGKDEEAGVAGAVVQGTTVVTVLDEQGTTVVSVKTVVTVTEPEVSVSVKTVVMVVEPVVIVSTVVTVSEPVLMVSDPLVMADGMVDVN